MADGADRQPDTVHGSFGGVRIVGVPSGPQPFGIPGAVGVGVAAPFPGDDPARRPKVGGWCDRALDCPVRENRYGFGVIDTGRLGARGPGGGARRHNKTASEPSWWLIVFCGALIWAAFGIVKALLS